MYSANCVKVHVLLLLIESAVETMVVLFFSAAYSAHSLSSSSKSSDVRLQTHKSHRLLWGIWRVCSVEDWQVGPSSEGTGGILVDGSKGGKKKVQVESDKVFLHCFYTSTITSNRLSR